MSRNVPLLGCLALAAVAIASRSASAATSIWALGDSITNGWSTTTVATPGGYREPLYQRLTAAGMAVDYVGTNTTNPGATLTAVGQPEHDGYPKYRIGHLIDNLDGNVQPPSTADTGNMPSNNGGYWLSQNGTLRLRPDLTLLLIGTNDVGGETKAGTPEAQIAPGMAALLDALVTKLLGYLPDTHLYLASIPPYTLTEAAAADEYKTRITQQYNELIRSQVVPKFQGLGYDVTFVDQYANFTLPDGTVNPALFGDTLHPNAAGYELMAATWANAIVPEPGGAATLFAVAALLWRRRIGQTVRTLSV